MDMKAYLSGIKAIVGYSTRKILLDKRWVIVLAVAILVGVVMGYAGSQDIDALDGGADLMDILILSFIMPVISMIYAASLLRNEIEDKSIIQVVTAPLERGVSYLGYFIALCISLSVIMILISAVGWICFFAQKGMGDGAVGILGAVCVLTVIGSVIYSALFMMTSVMFKHPIYFGLFFAFIWEAFVGSIPGAIGHYTVKHLIRSVGSSWIDFGNLASYDASSGAGIVIVVCTVIFLAIGIVRFREMEFP